MRKLPPYQHNPKDALSEFDVWVTPSLGSITDSQKFKETRVRIANILQHLSDVNSASRPHRQFSFSCKFRKECI